MPGSRLPAAPHAGLKMPYYAGLARDVVDATLIWAILLLGEVELKHIYRPFQRAV